MKRCVIGFVVLMACGLIVGEETTSGLKEETGYCQGGLKMKIHWLCAVGLMLICEAARCEEKPRVSVDAIKLPGSVVEFKMVELPGGKVTIKDAKGKEKEVEVRPFAIGQYEVMWDEYDVYWLALDMPESQRHEIFIQKDKIRPSRPYEPPDRGWGRHGSPAGSMFCKEAKRYCEWLSKVTGHKYRLATEAEWEYACKAGGSGKFTKPQLKDVAWFADNSDDQTHPCGKMQPNAFGLYDMLGNVAEWVTREDGSECVAGGSYWDESADVHSGARENVTAIPPFPAGKSWMSNGGHVGFRLVRDLESEKSRIKVKLPQGGFAMEMVRLAEGKVTTKDKDGKPVDQPIKGIWIGKYEVKYGQYNPFWQLLDLPEREGSKKFDAKSRPSKPYRLQYFESDDFPACGVSLLGAQKYCEWLSAQTGKKFRLPTEAEWEYACRAGEKDAKVDEKRLDFVAWYEKNAEEAPHEVGKLMCNAWGIYDMQGNVAEWVSVGEEHAVKGGSFADGAGDLSPSIRTPYTKLWQRDDPKEPKSTWWLSNGGFVGFRVVFEE